MPQNSNQTVAVAGSTGFVGRYAVRALLESGYAVRALVRDRAKASKVLPIDHDRLTIIEGCVFDSSATAEFAAGAQATVNAIGIRREFPKQGITYERLHPGATGLLCDAAAAAGHSRMVLVSAMGTRDGAPTNYWRTKWEAERLVRTSGLGWTILRPSLVHGPDGEFIGMIQDWVMGRAAPRFFLPYFMRAEGLAGFPPVPQFATPEVQPVAVEDVSQAIAGALSSDDAEGEIYPLMGPERLSWPELLKIVRDALPMGSKSMPALALPAPVGTAMAMGAKAVGLADALPFGASEPAMAAEDSVGSSAKAQSDLRFTPSPFSSRVRAYAASV